jgi:hypothetical protein
MVRPLLVLDACRTYELTWAIREASERSRAARLAARQTTVFEEEAEAEA